MERARRSIARVRDAIERMGECANERMLAAAAVAGDGASPAGEPSTIPLTGRRVVSSISYRPIEHCGRTVDA